ncbi:MAG: hypothetical protein R2795_04745 [Saprospiraceae bacterium]
MKNLIFVFLLASFLFMERQYAQPNPINMYTATAPIDIKIYGNGAQYWLVTGDNLTRQGKWEEAILAYDNAVVHLPEWSVPYIKRSVAKARMGRQQEAKQDLHKANQLSQFGALLYNELYPIGKYRLMAVSIGHAKGNHPEKMSDIASLKQKGQFTNASVLIKQLFNSRQIDDTSYAFLYGNLHLLQNQQLEAIAYYDWLLDRGEEASVLHNRGLAKLMIYNFADGCHDLERASQLGHQPSAEQYSAFCNM